MTASGDGYTITFDKQGPVTITNGKDGASGKDGTAPVIGVTAIDGVYYWTLNGTVLTGADGNNLPVTGPKGDNGTDGADGTNGTDGADAVAPQVRINGTSLEWEISADGGATWQSTGVVAKGADGSDGSGGGSLFSSVDTSVAGQVTFVLAGGGSFTVPVDTALSLTFQGLTDGVFEFPADNAVHRISYASTGAVARVGIVSAVPAGWTVAMDAAVNQIKVSAGAAGTLQVLITATSAQGASASYWVELRATVPPAPPATSLQDQIDMANSGDEIVLAPNTDYKGQVTIDKNITLTGAAGTIISAVNPPAVAGVAGNGENPVIAIKAGVTVMIQNVTITTKNSTAGSQVDGITIVGDASPTSLTLDNVTFDGIIPTGFTGAQNGRCVTVYGAGSVLTVTNSVFRNFNKNGIHMMAGTANVSASRFTGIDYAASGANGSGTNYAAQNGIVFMDGSNGSVTGCTFTDFRYGNAASSSTAVLLYQLADPDVVIDGGGNTYTNCDFDWTVN